MVGYTEAYIEQLIGKFMEGETSLEEEAQLGDYFRSQPVRPEWEEYRMMFAYFDCGMKEQEGQEDKRTHRSRRWRRIGVAACLALVCGLVAHLWLVGERMEVAQMEKPRTTQQAENVAMTPTKGRETAQTKAPQSVEKSSKAGRKHMAKVRRMPDADVEQAKQDLEKVQQEMATAYREIEEAFWEAEETHREVEMILAEAKFETERTDADVHGSQGEVLPEILEMQ